MSNPYKWSETRRFGNAQLDDKHQQLIALCNRAAQCTATVTREERSEFHLILNDLAALLEQQFSLEESMLEKNRCPNLTAHKLAHLSYLEEMADLLYAATAGELNSTALQTFSQVYLTEHLFKMDVADKVYLVE